MTKGWKFCNKKYAYAVFPTPPIKEIILNQYMV